MHIQPVIQDLQNHEFKDDYINKTYTAGFDGKTIHRTDTVVGALISWADKVCRTFRVTWILGDSEQRFKAIFADYLLHTKASPDTALNEYARPS